MTKGDLMNKLFTKEELANIDVAIPHEMLKSQGGSINDDELFCYVMDYNGNYILGRLVDMREVAKERNIKIEELV